MAPLPAMEHPHCDAQNRPSPPIAFHRCCAGKTRVFTWGISGLNNQNHEFLPDLLKLWIIASWFSFSFLPFLSRVTYLHLSHHITITSHHHINLLVSLSAVDRVSSSFQRGVPCHYGEIKDRHCTSAPMFLYMQDISFAAHSNHRILS